MRALTHTHTHTPVNEHIPHELGFASCRLEFSFQFCWERRSFWHKWCQLFTGQMLLISTNQQRRSTKENSSVVTAAGGNHPLAFPHTAADYWRKGSSYSPYAGCPVPEPNTNSKPAELYHSAVAITIFLLSCDATDQTFIVVVKRLDGSRCHLVRR